MDKYKWINPPILIGGRALEHYKIRKSGHDYDYIISDQDYDKIKSMPNIKNDVFPPQTPGIHDTNNDTDYFVSLYGITYDKVKINAKKHKKILICSINDLLLIKSFTAFDNVNRVNKATQKKQLNDVKLIINHMIKN